MRHYSTAVMVEHLVGMLDTGDLSDWEESFVKTLQRYAAGQRLADLSDKQVEALDQLHSRHFA